MNCPAQEQWDLLSMGLADEEALSEHAAMCGACRERRSQANRIHEELARAHLPYRQDHERLREDLLARLPSEAPPSRARPARPDSAAPPSLPFLSSRSRMIRRRLFPLMSAAAAILIAVTVLVFHGGAGVALAEVTRAVGEMQSVTYTVRITSWQGEEVNGPPNRQSLLSQAFGSRIDRFWDDGRPFLTEFVLPQQARWVTLFHDDLEYTVKLMEDDEPAIMTAATSPSGWFGQLMSMAQHDEPQRLGRSIINGRSVEGIECGPTTDHWGTITTTIRMWIDTATHLPVLIEVETRGQGPRDLMVELYENLHWSAVDEPAAFAEIIPAGYEERPPLPPEP